MSRRQGNLQMRRLNELQFSRDWSWQYNPETDQGSLTYHGCHPPICEPMPYWMVEIIKTVKHGALDQLRKDIRAIPQLKDTGEESFDVS